LVIFIVTCLFINVLVYAKIVLAKLRDNIGAVFVKIAKLRKRIPH